MQLVGRVIKFWYGAFFYSATSVRLKKINGLL